MANAFRIGVAGDMRPDNRTPLLLEREFHHAALKTMGLNHPCDKIGKGGERSTGLGHAGAHLSPRCARGQVGMLTNRGQPCQRALVCLNTPEASVSLIGSAFDEGLR